MDDSSIAPPADLLYRRRISIALALRRLWGVRELVRTVAERDFRARYKQAVLGIAWAIITPLVFMAAFTLVFDKVADVDTGGVPYPLFSLMGLLPWSFFATSLNRGSGSLLENKSLLNKVAFPREVFPLASVGVAGIDAALSLSSVAVLFAAYGFMPEGTIYWVPVLLLVQVAFALGAALLAAIAVVYLRDLQYVVPMVLQLGLFVTPVGYPLEAVDERLRPVFSLLDPLVPVIDGYRRAVLYGQAPQWGLLALGGVGALGYLALGYTVFKRLEGGVADVS
jgi:ABC-2 type transport system permease protein/lipopolysaccharide transport system permease protein